MKIDILTIFPDFFRGPLDYGIVRRVREAGLATIEVHDLRAFAHDRHRTVDDRPFGGGEGMVLKPEPIFECIEGLSVQSRAERLAPGAKQSVVLLSAQGRRFDQGIAEELAELERIVLICGRYEGVDERVGQHLADRELSIGDYVLSGGELGAAVILDTVTRLIPGALGNEASARQESFTVATAVELVAPTPLAHRVDCWIIRITPGRRTFVDCRCLKFWSQAIMKRYAAGAGARLWKKPGETGPTCWTGPRWATKIKSYWPESRAKKIESSKISVTGEKIVTNLIIEKLLAKTKRTDIPEFVPGDSVRVHVKIKEGDKERLQAFEGVVIARSRGRRPALRCARSALAMASSASSRCIPKWWTRWS